MKENHQRTCNSILQSYVKNKSKIRKTINKNSKALDGEKLSVKRKKIEKRIEKSKKTFQVAEEKHFILKICFEQFPYDHVRIEANKKEYTSQDIITNFILTKHAEHQKRFWELAENEINHKGKNKISGYSQELVASFIKWKTIFNVFE